MVTIKKIQSPLFSKLYESFLIDDDPYSGEAEWRNVFDYRWDSGQDYCGYAMLDQDQVVGMIGMIFSERVIDGAARRFCNLHTWWVREDQRGRSLFLLRPVLKLHGYTITHFTPCDTVRAVSRKLGFQDLNSQLKILLPGGGSLRRRTMQSADFVDDESTIAARLDEADHKILSQHQPYRCGHLLVSGGDAYCYLLYTHVVRHRLPYCHIHYISNRGLFAEQEPAIRSWLLQHHRARFVAVDARLVAGITFPFSFNFWAPAHGLYKSADLRPDQIDNLYSDVVFLQLTVLPDMSNELARRLRRWWPRGGRRQ